MARDYSKVLPDFWTGDTGRAIRGDADAQRVGFYLITCPAANMIGLYYLSLPALCHEIGISPEGASKGLRRLSEEAFAHYDEGWGHVYVPNMASIQIGESLKPKDNRVRHVQKLFDAMRKSKFAKDFWLRYHKAYHMATVDWNPSPFEAPSKPLRSQEQEQEQEQEQSDHLHSKKEALAIDVTGSAGGLKDFCQITFAPHLGGILPESEALTQDERLTLLRIAALRLNHYLSEADIAGGLEAVRLRTDGPPRTPISYLVTVLHDKADCDVLALLPRVVLPPTTVDGHLEEC